MRDVARRARRIGESGEWIEYWIVNLSDHKYGYGWVQRAFDEKGECATRRQSNGRTDESQAVM